MMRMSTIYLTDHATERYQDRVAPSFSAAEARMALQRFVGMGTDASRAAALDVSARAEPGTRFVYWSQQRDVCAILRDGAVVTVITRELVRSSPRRHLRLVRA